TEPGNELRDRGRGTRRPAAARRRAPPDRGAPQERALHRGGAALHRRAAARAGAARARRLGRPARRVPRARRAVELLLRPRVDLPHEPRRLPRGRAPAAAADPEAVLEPDPDDRGALAPGRPQPLLG